MTELDKWLSSVERSRLSQLEGIVDQGMRTFVEVGNALQEIRSSQLYRGTHATFKAYCEERFGFSDSRGRQLIAAAKTVTDVTAAGLPAPRTEGEARRLARELRAKDGSSNSSTSTLLIEARIILESAWRLSQRAQNRRWKAAPLIWQAHEEGISEKEIAKALEINARLVHEFITHHQWMVKQAELKKEETDAQTS